MSLLVLILYLALIGLLTWVVVTYVPMPQPFKTVIIAVAIILTVLWILSVMGVNFPTVPHVAR